MKARKFAYQALCEIILKKTYSNLYLKEHLNKVDEKDRALASNIVYGTLQNHRYVRYQWEYLAKNPVKKEVAILLDMSVYQLLYLENVPSYAILNEAVDLAKKSEAKMGSFVNGVLRNVMRNGKRGLPKDEMEALSIRYSYPLWLLKMWSAQYGNELMLRTVHAFQQVQRNSVRVNRMKASPQQLIDTGDFEKGRMCEDALFYIGDAPLATTSYYLEGMVSMQDEASMMVARIMNPKANDKVLDMCSAPGSKACHMAELMHDEGVVVCCDIHPHRVELIRAGAKRLHLKSLQPMVNDATKLEHLQPQSFDRVLCDVPCSGYGVLGRKSDIKLHMESSDMDTLIPLQYDILKQGALMLKPQGVLVYSTCTLNKKENEKQIERFMKEHPNFKLLGMKTIFPHQCQSDGFFIAKLRKENG
ncbi:MAG: 16S rRNA (cytosine(967)-C(5))-methyltransferase RsmB [Longicatena sp.]|nr:16S rRNA (cytosine(967)-C(5))-methyltransferase RsmB [Longicatena sp.]